MSSQNTARDRRPKLVYVSATLVLVGGLVSLTLGITLMFMVAAETTVFVEVPFSNLFRHGGNLWGILGVLLAFSGVLEIIESYGIWRMETWAVWSTIVTFGFVVLTITSLSLFRIVFDPVLFSTIAVLATGVLTMLSSTGHFR